MILANPTQKQDVSRKELYKALLRSLRRRKGFGLVFVQCSPGEAKRLLPQLVADLPQKNIGVLELTESIDNLYEKIFERPDCKSLNILFIQGLEKSLESDIKPGYGGDGDYYNLSSVPRILSHLNQQRERFRDNFGDICFVFILPEFAIKYFIRRAPDFFDWGTGVFELPDESLKLSPSLQNTIIKESEIEKVSCKDELSFEDGKNQYQKYFDLGCRLSQLGHYEGAIANFDKALQFKPDSHEALYNLGYVHGQLGHYAAELASYNEALRFKRDFHEAWYNRGYVLGQFGQYEAAIASYDKALQFKPDKHEAWNNRGYALGQLGQYEAAIASYDKALQLNPDPPETWIQRGIVLFYLGDYEAAIASHDKVLQLKPDHPEAWYQKACCYAKQTKLELALENLKKALEYSTDEYREMVKIDPNFDSIRDNERFQALITV
jgi:tetratricopeptide (TPR) repeat protein